MVAATLGGVAGGILVVPLAVVSPGWLFLTLPQVLGGVFASGPAYLVAGPAGTSLSRTLAASLVAAAVCVPVNLALLGAVAAGVVGAGDLLLPGGWATHLLEAVAIGAVAGLVATRRGRTRRARRGAVWKASAVSVVAIVTLLGVASSIAA